jgi:hypothetical protein
MMNKFQQYLLNYLVILDEAGNAITGGSPHETISSRAYKAWQAGRHWGCILCRLLDWIEKDHCKIASESVISTDAVIPDGR